MACVSQSQSVIEESQGGNHREKLLPGLPAMTCMLKLPFLTAQEQLPRVAAVPEEIQHTSIHPRKGTRTDESHGYTNVQFGEPESF